MEDQQKRYLYFSVKNYTGSATTSSYTLPITPFTLVPKFDSGDNLITSNTNILWDFGDGTFSKDITATHFYKIPGTYNIKCYFYGTSGNGFESTFCQNVLVKDFIPDTLVLSADEYPNIRASHVESPFVVTRYNSWQTFDTLSAAGSTILLYASATGGDLLDVNVYQQDKYSHLKPSARFLISEYNNILSSYDPMPVNSFKTIGNSEIYVKLNSSKQVVFCESEDEGAVLAGTSGRRIVYYVDDIVKEPVDKIIPPVIVLAYFDTSTFFDADSKKYEFTNNFPILNTIANAVYTPTIIDSKGLGSLSITSNGIDNEGSIIIDSFNIGKNKFLGQKIPIIIKIKDLNGYPVKSVSKLKLTSYDEALVLNSIKIYLTDASTNEIIPDAIDIYEDYGEFESYEKLGFFKGYIVPKIIRDNVKICAQVNAESKEYYYIISMHAAISNPSSTYFHLINFRYVSDLNLLPRKTTDTLKNTTNLSGIYCSIVVPDSTNKNYFWFADSDRDIISKYNNKGVKVFDKALPLSSSPSFLAADSKGSVWTTMHDSVSACKLDSTGKILFYTKPASANLNTDDIALYEALSGFAGSNTILPATVDIDLKDNAWITYNYPLSSFICQYTSAGELTNIYTPDYGLQPYNIICDGKNRTWVLLKNIKSTDQDQLMKIEDDVANYFPVPVDNKVWSFAVDADDDLWFTSSDEFSKNNILYFNTESEAFDTDAIITLPSVNTLHFSPDCNFVGIACNTNNDVMVVDIADNDIKGFNKKNSDIAFNIPLKSVTPTIYGDILNAQGDWAGFNYINKFRKNRSGFAQISGCSNVFDINPPTGKYNIAKLNENFDMGAQYSAFAFQESIADCQILLNDFIGSCVGNINDDPNTLGKKVYEKISNLVDNISFVDTCNINQLQSMYQLFNEYQYKFNGYDFPGDLSRIVNLISIKLSKLKGTRNKFDENFDQYGYISNQKYGKNLGNELNFYSHILTGGIDGYIVAYEKFSQSYTKCNTNVLTARYINPTLSTYALSSYNPHWGWNLVLPPIYTNEDITKYYSFFEYSSGYANEQLEGIINWSDSFTTINENITSYNQWYDIAENMITKELVQGLELLSANY